MKIVFLSNFFNHHQSALSDALWQKTNENYTFIETGNMSEECKLLGYTAIQKPYTLSLKGNEKKAEQRILDADVVITGSAPEWLVRKRIKAGKLVFRYCERPLKKGIEWWKYFPRLVRWHWRNPYGKPIYMLCASAYTAGDYAKFGLFPKRTYQWGYFPETKRYDDVEKVLASKHRARLLWCGRFVNWKHPDDAINTAYQLKSEGYQVSLELIGRGEMEEKLRWMVKAYQLEDCVHFLGSMAPDKVRQHMEQAGIYLVTSDRQEGWGAVLNESMNSGCAVIASHAVGAAAYLVKDGENGLIYESGNLEMLYEKLKYLLEHSEEQQRLGREAYKTILKEWNGQEAAKRLICLAEAILDGEQRPDLYSGGPCSIGRNLDDKWKREN